MATALISLTPTVRSMATSRLLWTTPIMASCMATAISSLTACSIPLAKYWRRETAPISLATCVTSFTASTRFLTTGGLNTPVGSIRATGSSLLTAGGRLGPTRCLATAGVGVRRAGTGLHTAEIWLRTTCGCHGGTATRLSTAQTANLYKHSKNNTFSSCVIIHIYII